MHLQTQDHEELVLRCTDEEQKNMLLPCCLHEKTPWTVKGDMNYQKKQSNLKQWSKKLSNLAALPDLGYSVEKATSIWDRTHKDAIRYTARCNHSVEIEFYLKVISPRKIWRNLKILLVQIQGFGEWLQRQSVKM